MKPLPYDRPEFLEPAHDHDPTEPSSLVDLPRLVLHSLPNEIQELLPAVREATSVVFASFNRLDDLVSQRLERLTLFPDAAGKQDEGQAHYSEPAYFWYQNQVRNEAQYFCREALPDWKHKTAKIQNEFARRGIMLDTETTRSEPNTEFVKWFSTLKDEVQGWEMIAETVEVPDFDQAVSDLRTMKAKKKYGDSAPSQQDLTAEEVVQNIEKVDSGIEL